MTAGQSRLSKGKRCRASWDVLLLSRGESQRHGACDSRSALQPVQWPCPGGLLILVVMTAHGALPVGWGSCTSNLQIALRVVQTRRAMFREYEDLPEWVRPWDSVSGLS